jgi:HSP20 family protein
MADGHNRKEHAMSSSLVPFQRELETIRERFDRLLADFSFPEFGTERFGIPVDLEETEEAYRVMASFPGAKPEDIEIDVGNDRLTLAVTTQSEKEEKTEGYLLRERRSGAARRVLTLPGPIRDQEATAELKDGVLTLTLPKAQPGERKKIEIRPA